ncbi:TRAP transporter small permease [Desulfosediminicola sp.]|uniref:TRAP transporter small permease n=1 Tax=Desulfosediminicola sp. TaxID=2886825 RepID=UPI003AF1F58D
MIERAVQLVDRVEKFTLVWTILGLALIGFVEVFTRYLLNYSFTWYEEVGRYLGVFIAFLGGSIGVKSGSHFVMDLFVTRIASPWQQFLRTITSLLSGTFFFLVAWYAWKMVTRLYGFETTSPTLEMPMYIAYLPIPFFSVVMGLRFCGQGFGHLRNGLRVVRDGGVKC